MSKSKRWNEDRAANIFVCSWIGWGVLMFIYVEYMRPPVPTGTDQFIILILALGALCFPIMFFAWPYYSMWRCEKDNEAGLPWGNTATDDFDSKDK